MGETISKTGYTQRTSRGKTKGAGEDLPLSPVSCDALQFNSRMVAVKLPLLSL